MRQQTLLIRIGDEDRVALDAAAAALGVSRAAIIRRALGALRGSQIAGDLESQIELKALQASMLATGRNLNQIARHLNSSRNVDAGQLAAVLSRIIALNDETRRMPSRLVETSQASLTATIQSRPASAQVRS
jgi:Bacterial mobilisation protein (MobC)